MRVAGQNPNCMLPQVIIDATVPDILHLEINTLKIYLIVLCLWTFRSNCDLGKEVWTSLKSAMPSKAVEVFSQAESFCDARAEGKSCPKRSCPWKSCC